MGGKISDNLAAEVSLLIDYVDDIREKLVAVRQRLLTQQSDQLKERETQLMLELGFEEPKVEKTIEEIPVSEWNNRMQEDILRERAERAEAALKGLVSCPVVAGSSTGIRDNAKALGVPDPYALALAIIAKAKGGGR